MQLRAHLVLTIVGSLSLAQSATSRPVVVDAESLRLEVYISRTAHLFHVVDQISEWSPYCHSQYRPMFTDANGAFQVTDREMLEAHKKIRETKPWGSGLEQTFYTSLDLDGAIAEGISRNYITKDQGTVERSVLNHFKDRIERLFESDRPRLEAFRDLLVASKVEIQAFATKISRFCGGAKVTVPVYLFANPSDRDFGGGYNGDRLTIELPRAYDAFPTLLHEAMHAFVKLQEKKLYSILEREKSLDFETLNEGIAYALSPGLYHPKEDADPLSASVAQNINNNMGLDDGPARCRRFGLALRPLLRESLDDTNQTMDTFLPRALDAWRVLRELDAARLQREKGWFCAGPAYAVLGDVARARGEKLIYATNHTKDHYKQLLDRAAPGSRLIFMFALDHADRDSVAGFDDLYPKPIAEIESALRRGEIVELQGRARGLDVVLLAAPTIARLEQLIRESKLLVHAEPLK
ncbi:MAG: hypothetical protein HY286_14230 [Planctomycetes bacterium]|nr:hypothetical protein [Planctomycetota bacterium]